jgi:hypothetical protein
MTARHRKDESRAREKGGKRLKYDLPANSSVCLDVPPSLRDKLRDLSEPLFVTEGPLKADSAVSHGVTCVDVLGVWTHARQESLLTDWDARLPAPVDPSSGPVAASSETKRSTKSVHEKSGSPVISPNDHGDGPIGPIGPLLRSQDPLRVERAHTTSPTRCNACCGTVYHANPDGVSTCSRCYPRAGALLPSSS